MCVERALLEPAWASPPQWSWHHSSLHDCSRCQTAPSCFQSHHTHTLGTVGLANTSVYAARYWPTTADLSTNQLDEKPTVFSQDFQLCLLQGDTFWTEQETQSNLWFVLALVCMFAAKKRVNTVCIMGLEIVPESLIFVTVIVIIYMVLGFCPLILIQYTLCCLARSHVMLLAIDKTRLCGSRHT